MIGYIMFTFIIVSVIGQEIKDLIQQTINDRMSDLDANASMDYLFGLLHQNEKEQVTAMMFANKNNAKDLNNEAAKWYMLQRIRENLVRINKDIEEQLDGWRWQDYHILNLHRMKIKSVKGLFFPKDLRDLDLAYNEISDIEALNDLNLPNLQLLWANGNNIKHMPLLGNLDLTDLHLDNNQIEDISAVVHLPSLKSLWLARNKIKIVDILNKLKHLEVLMLRQNEIENASELTHLEKLRQLYLHDNPISDYADVCKMHSKLERQDFYEHCTN